MQNDYLEHIHQFIVEMHPDWEMIEDFMVAHGYEFRDESDQYLVEEWAGV